MAFSVIGMATLSHSKKLEQRLELGPGKKHLLKKSRQGWTLGDVLAKMLGMRLAVESKKQ